MAEEVSFVVDSNLDIIAKQAKILSQNVEDLYKAFRLKNVALTEQNRLESLANNGIRSLTENYSGLTTNISGVINKNKDFNSLIGDSNSTMSSIIGTINQMNQGFNNLEERIDSAGNKWQQIGPGVWQMSTSDKDFKETMKKIREMEQAVQNFIKSMLDGIHKIGAQLIVEAADLKPFALTFMDSFSINPMKFFGFGAAMKEGFELMKFFQQMRHELAYLSDSSGDASKAVSLVYEVAGGSAVASGTATGILRSLSDQGILANDQLKSLGILSGDLQAATGIAAASWASFAGELSFNYGIPTEGIKNITSALIGTNIRGAQLEKVMQSVNKILSTTGFIAGKPTTESVKGLAKEVGGASKVFQSMGISAEKATGFIEGILDPENFEKNSFLFGKLGISASEYAGYLNDADGQQKLLQKTMQNLPQLAEEITNIENPFARMQLAKTLGLDMQIVRNMAGKSKADIEQMLADYEKANAANEALEAKKKRMAAEAAKFDDMMMGLKLKVLGPVMKFLSDGYLDRFIGVLPKIATSIGTIFETMTPIIEAVTNALMEVVPYVTQFVKDFVVPFIKMFPQILNGLLDMLPGFKRTETKELPKPGPKASKEEIDTYNKNRADNMFTVGSDILSYLSKIYLFVLGWKAFNMITDGLSKMWGMIDPKSNTLMNTSLRDYLKGMKEIQTPGPGGGGNSMLTTLAGVALAGVVSGGLVYITKKIVGSPTFETFLDREKTNKMTGTEVATEVFKNAGQDASIRGATTLVNSVQQAKTIKEVSDAMKIQKEIMAARGIADTASKGTKIMEAGESLFSMAAMKTAAQSPLAKVFGKATLGLGVGLDAYNLTTGTTRAETWGAGASLASTIVGGIIGGVTGAAAGGVGAIPGAIAGAQIGQLIGVPLGFIASSVGGFVDSMDENAEYAKNKSELLQNTFETGISGIFKAFKAGDFTSLSKLLSLSLSNLYLQAKSKVLSFIPFAGTENKATREKAQKIMTDALNFVNSQPANMSEEAIQITLNDFKKKLNNMADEKMFTGLSSQTRDEFILAIETQAVNAKMLRDEISKQTAEVKDGNKDGKERTRLAKEAAERAKKDAEAKAGTPVERLVNTAFAPDMMYN
jgi:hypothetical protein